MKLNYKLDKESYKEGLIFDYTRRRELFDYIKGVIFLGLVVIFLVLLYKNPYFGIAWVAVAICLGYLVYTLLFARDAAVKRAMEGYDTDRDNRYELTLEGSVLAIDYYTDDGELKEDEPSCLPYPEFSMGFEYNLAKRYVKAYETDSYIGLYSGYANIIPKNKLTPEQLEELTRTLKSIMGKRYIIK